MQIDETGGRQARVHQRKSVCSSGYLWCICVSACVHEASQITFPDWSGTASVWPAGRFRAREKLVEVERRQEEDSQEERKERKIKINGTEYCTELDWPRSWDSKVVLISLCLSWFRRSFSFTLGDWKRVWDDFVVARLEMWLSLSQCMKKHLESLNISYDITPSIHCSISDDVLRK